MRTNYVLIDYENVQPVSLRSLDRENFKVLVFLGENQKKISVEFASSLQGLGERAQYVTISGNGPNALDFHIAFYIGELAAADPKGFFHIISKDSGFDPLVAHLKTRDIFSRRSVDIGDIPALKAESVGKPPASDERQSKIIVDLRKRGAAKPRSIATLKNAINTLFQKTMDSTELDACVRQLQDAGVVLVSGTKVSYALP